MTNYLSSDEIDGTLNGLAVASGRTREDLEAELQTLVIPEKADHLDFMEAIAVDSLASERQKHLDACDHCQRLVETMYPTHVQLEEFENRVRAELERGYPRRRFGGVSKMVASVAVGLVVGMFVPGLARNNRSATTYPDQRTAIHAPTSMRPVDARVPNVPQAIEFRRLDAQLGAVDARLRVLPKSNTAKVEQAQYHIDRAREILARAAPASVEQVARP
jgi:hypothetical protein